MKKAGRYDTSGIIETQFESGSHGRVLRNKLEIKSKREMDKIERQEQFRAMEELTGSYDGNHRFTVDDICMIHKIWLEKIYEWAGRYRQVNLSKSEFLFAAAAQVPKLMMEVERGSLRKYTPCRFESLKEIIEALAVVHTELVLIHPFREGNGPGGSHAINSNGIAGRAPAVRFQEYCWQEEKRIYFSGTGRDVRQLWPYGKHIRVCYSQDSDDSRMQIAFNFFPGTLRALGIL